VTIEIEFNNTVFYILGGYEMVVGFLDTVEQYDKNTETFTPMAAMKMPEEKSHFCTLLVEVFFTSCWGTCWPPKVVLWKGTLNAIERGNARAGERGFARAFAQTKDMIFDNIQEHSDYRTVSTYWVLPVYVELIRAVWADDGDR
jgi:hypothetical protein